MGKIRNFGSPSYNCRNSGSPYFRNFGSPKIRKKGVHLGAQAISITPVSVCVRACVHICMEVGAYVRSFVFHR